jgi:hypothetical protein
MRFSEWLKQGITKRCRRVVYLLRGGWFFEDFLFVNIWQHIKKIVVKCCAYLSCISWIQLWYGMINFPKWNHLEFGTLLASTAEQPTMDDHVANRNFWSKVNYTFATDKFVYPSTAFLIKEEIRDRILELHSWLRILGLNSSLLRLKLCLVF